MPPPAETEPEPSKDEPLVGEPGDAPSGEKLEPWMDPAEIDVIAAFLRPSTVMLEFGSGGSTLHWSKRVAKLYTVEHTPVWRDQVAEGCRQAGCTNVELLAFPPDRAAFDRLGCTPRGIYEPSSLPNWCSPNFDPAWREASTEDRVAVFKDYIGAAAATGESRFDVVLVDGRCRGECAIAVLPFIDERSVVLIHDWLLEEEGIMPGVEQGTAPYLAQPGASAEGFLKLPARAELPSYKRVLEHYEILAQVSPETHPGRCTRCGLVALRKKAA